jgi:hypothetical protein
MAAGLVFAFSAGFGTHFLYERWNSSGERHGVASVAHPDGQNGRIESHSHRVTLVPGALTSAPVELPLLPARDTEKIRGLAGNQARIRGRVFRVGHSAKSNTYFLAFGPSREALTAVIFASAVELFEKKRLSPKSFEGKEIEVLGVVKIHPQYGLEIILESPAQIRLVN